MGRCAENSSTRGRDLETDEGRVYYNAARCHAYLEGYSPLTFADGNTVGPADLNQVRWVCTAGISCRSQSPPDNELESHRLIPN